LSDTPKKTFGKYEAISHLGSGAMGVVWRAQDPVLGRTVAIKTISAALGSDNENKERFLREARAAAQLNHPNIITVYDFGQADNELYMAMELLEGKDLKELITQGQLTFDQKLDIMEQVADGLAYAHGRDVIHRDLKPGNIHVQPNGQVKILDFGLARLGSSDLTKTGVVMGTPNYMSPEQVMGERVDARSDVFSAGAVFYELLTNRKPFDAESVHATLYQVVHRDAPPPRQWDPRLPDAIVTIIEIAMNKSVDGRYKNAGALRDAIRAFRYGEEPEVVEYEENQGEPTPEEPSGDATAITAIPPAVAGSATPPASTSASGAQKVAPFRSYGRTGSVPPSAGVSSAPYTTGRINRPSTSRPPARPAGPGDPRTSSASVPPPQRSNAPLIVGGLLALVVVVGLIGYGIVSRQAPDNKAIDALTASLVETQLDLARRVLEDKDYKGAITRANGILKLDARNPEALAIREQAQSATREIETSVAAAREAVARGDSAQASASLEKVMALDPKNPVVSELSSQLNANFAKRATDAKSEMEKAKTLAQAKEGAAQDPAFAEGDKFVETAAQNLKDRQYTAATQTYLQARDAYDRARRVIENKERDAAKAKPTTTPVIVAGGTTTVSTPVPLASPLPTVNLRPLPTATVAPATPAPTAVVLQTPPPLPTVAAAAAEVREFVTGRTRVNPAPDAKDTPFGKLVLFGGKFEFEVTPSPLVPGAPFKVRIFLKNDGKNDAKLDTLTVKIGRNGEVSNPPVRISEDNIKVDQRPLVAEIPGTWVAGTTAWVMDVEAMSKKGERFRSSLTMKQP
jgi:serine/threonine protein kinase